MSTSLIIIILLIVAFLLMAVEVFIIPGFGISGVLSAISVVVADILIYNEFGGWAAFFALVLFGMFTLLLVWWVAHSKAIDKVALHSSIDSTNATKEQLSVKVGDQGIALTRLALIGNASIEGKTVEVKSAGKFIEEGASIVVTEVKEALILVKEQK